MGVILEMKTLESSGGFRFSASPSSFLSLPPSNAGSITTPNPMRNEGSYQTFLQIEFSLNFGPGH